MGIFGLFESGKLVAIDIGMSSIKIAEVDTTRGGPILLKFAILPIPSGLVTNGEINNSSSVTHAIVEAAKAARSKRKTAVTGMSGSSVIVKKISMPKLEKSLIAEQIKWEAEQYIPFDINEISLEHTILTEHSSKSESMEVLLVAAKQEFIFRIIETIEAGGYKCALVDVAGFALANCFEANYGVVDCTVALLHFGAGSTHFVIIDKGEVVFCRDLALGGSAYTTDISKSMGVSFEEAESLKISAAMKREVPDEINKIIKDTNEQMVDEIRNSFEFYGATAAGATVSRFYVSGGGALVPGMVDMISKAVNIPHEMFDPFKEFRYDTKALSPDYIQQIKMFCPIVLGLAMRKLE